MVTSSGGGGGGRSILTVADRGEGVGVKFAKILLTSYVNAPLRRHVIKPLNDHISKTK